MSSKIEWTGETWNPVAGCAPVSPGCANCYAARHAYRLASMRHDKYFGVAERCDGRINWTGAVKLAFEALNEPLRRRRATTYFVCSMADLFHDDVPAEFLAQVWQMMYSCPQHTFQVLTKRPRGMRDFLETYSDGSASLPNLWLGVSCEDQQRADERMPLLWQCPAAVRFVSLEPLLGPIDLDQALPEWWESNGIDWVIVGGESGPGARPCQVEWIRDIVEKCRGAAVPVFVKQLGAAYSDAQNGVAGKQLRFAAEVQPLLSSRLNHPKGGDPSEWPMDLRVREMPAV